MKKVILILLGLLLVGCGAIEGLESYDFESLLVTPTPHEEAVPAVYPTSTATQTAVPTVEPTSTQIGCVDVDITVECIAVGCNVRTSRELGDDNVAYVIPKGTQFVAVTQCGMWYGNREFWIYTIDGVWE